MFFIAGKRSNTIDHGPILPLTCSNCHAVDYWHLIQSKSSVTVFFVPTVGVNNSHILSCPRCGYSTQLSDNQVQRAYWIKQFTVAFGNKQITEEEYKKRLAEINYLH